MNTSLCFLLLASIIVGISCNPANHQRQRRQNNVNQSPTPTPGTTTTTPSPRYTACTNACLTTQEYNPVCGSDGITYNNLGRLRCANRCGKNVRQLFGGACQAAT